MQTQTQTVRAKPLKKIIYSSCFVGIVSLVLAYVACTVYFKFFAVDEKTMGTMFYSWRAEGADESSLKEKADKIPGTESLKSMKAVFENYVSDSFPIHLPRFAANHFTFAYPNMDIFLNFRKHIVDAQNALFSSRSEESIKALKDYNKKVNGTVYYSNAWETSNDLDGIIEEFYSGLSADKKDVFRNSTVRLIDLFDNLVNDDSYKFNGVEPSEKAIEDLSDILYNFSARGAGEENKLLPYVQNNADMKIFLKSIGLQDKTGKELSSGLASVFFNSLTNGVLYPYFSYGYSTAVNTLLYLCLDMQDLAYDENVKLELEDSIKEVAEEQQKSANRISAFGSAIAYGIAKNLSPAETVGEKTVKDNSNMLVFSLFTSKLATPSSETPENLEKIVAHLKKKRDLLLSLSKE
ncbi:hypothetical protein NEMIN01_1209 [Nematocida minor]|uniref:uncharacterized protein n=1 Tax=Nematocida minor TaxID=1912983 RepID=UPI00221E71C5|nr:uncharacterized protein NEMIN01_1209 [Nematocida minor]KAI5190807.1 hypothetical protein NEMIN01_1209 [Nematocida minor]